MTFVPISPDFLDLLPVDCLLKIVEFLPMHVRLKGMSTLPAVELDTQCRAILDLYRDAPSHFWHIFVFVHFMRKFVSFLWDSFVIIVSVLSPIIYEFLKMILRRFGKIAPILVLDRCHRFTGNVLKTIATLPSIRSVSLKWCHKNYICILVRLSFWTRISIAGATA